MRIIILMMVIVIIMMKIMSVNDSVIIIMVMNNLKYQKTKDTKNQSKFIKEKIKKIVFVGYTLVNPVLDLYSRGGKIEFLCAKNSNPKREFKIFFIPLQKLGKTYCIVLQRKKCVLKNFLHKKYLVTEIEQKYIFFFVNFII